MILLDQTDRRPIYEQIVERLSELMINGVLEENTPLPSVRNMAAELSINPNTVQRAYNELDRLGFTYTVKGRGTFVAGLSGIKKLHLEQLLCDAMKSIERLKAAGFPERELTDRIHSLYTEEKDDKAKGGGGID